MPSYRPIISRTQYHNLEAYQFKLIQYISCMEFRDMKSDKQQKIYIELARLDTLLPLLHSIFSSANSIEKSVVAWSIKDEEPDIHKFSSIIVAAKALSCNNSKISAVCRGNRPHTGGYVFMYESDYIDKLNSLQENFNPNSNEFKTHKL